jgi:hypothetical protein
METDGTKRDLENQTLPRSGGRRGMSRREVSAKFIQGWMNDQYNEGALPPVTAPHDAQGPWDRELVKAIAMDIGKDMVAYIEVMYPKAIEATSSTFKLSVRNHIHNQVMAAIELRDEADVRAWLAGRKKRRREWVGMYRKMRKDDAAAPLDEATKIRALADRVRLRERGWLRETGYVKNVTLTIEEAETVEKALLLLAELEDKTITIPTDTGSVT